jgi:hypothetical protein
MTCDAGTETLNMAPEAPSAPEVPSAVDVFTDEEDEPVRGRGRDGGGFTGECWNCNEYGHRSAQCPQGGGGRSRGRGYARRGRSGRGRGSRSGRGRQRGDGATFWCAHCNQKGHTMDHCRAKSTPCRFFNPATPFCYRGGDCPYLHGEPTFQYYAAPEAPSATEGAVACPDGGCCADGGCDADMACFAEGPCGAGVCGTGEAGCA